VEKSRKEWFYTRNNNDVMIL